MKEKLHKRFYNQKYKYIVTCEKQTYRFKTQDEAEKFKAFWRAMGRDGIQLTREKTDESEDLVAVKKAYYSFNAAHLEGLSDG